MRLWAIVAVLAVGVSIPLLRTDPETRLVPAPDMPAVGVRPVVYDLDFADDRHGFALFGRCAEACQSKLLTTEDGMTWVARQFSMRQLAGPKQLTARIV